MTINSVPKVSKDIVYKEENDIAVLFDPNNGRVNVLNETGRFIWNKLDGKNSRDDIVNCILEEFDIEDKNKAETDLDKFLGYLSGLKAIDGYKSVKDFPESICFGITSKCNLSCKHCMNRNVSKGEDMSLEKIYSLIDEIKNEGGKSITLFGGEPLLHENFKEIVEYLNKNKISMSLNTNASLIDQEMAKWLKEHNIKGATISFDGSCKEVMDEMRGEGAFDSAVKGIKAMVKEGSSILLSCTVTKINHKDLRKMLKFGKSLGAKSIRFNHVFFSGNASCLTNRIYLKPEEELEAVEEVAKLKDEFGDFLYKSSSYLQQKIKINNKDKYKPKDIIKVNPCGAGMNRCTIRPDGYVTPCEVIWEVKCGNVHDSTLKEIWQNSECMNSFREPMELDLNDMGECKNCSFQYLCFQGHRCYPYYYPGGIKNKDLYCWLKT